MRIARAGLPILAAVAFLAAVLAALKLFVPAVVLAVAAGYVTFFFRDPERRPPAGEGLILAPGDGRVVDVQAGPDGTRVSTFLGLLDVHVNRAPAAGVVAAVERRSGRHLAAYRPDSARRNQQVISSYDTPGGPIRMAQVVGVLARRIEFWKRPGDAVRAGDRVGIMKFGSRIDLDLPAGVVVAVQVGDRVRAGESVLGRLSRVPGPAAGGEGG